MPAHSDSILQKSIFATEEITLSYKQSVFTFEFSALDFTRPEKNQYAYMLEGFDHEWNYVGNRTSATYTNLDPGEYTFRVKGSNADGVWNEKGTSVDITIKPPFWLTWWFRSTLVTLVIGGLVAFYFVRIGRVNRHRTMLEQLVSVRTKEIVGKNEEIARQKDSIEQQNTLLGRSKTELEHKVRERTIELSHSNQELIRQNVQLEQFAFMTAHNLRAPVARLLGLISIFNNQNLGDPTNAEVIKRIGTSAMGLDEVIRDIADILQVQKGVHYKFEPITVLPAIQKALKALHHEIKDHRIAIQVDISPSLVINGIPAYVQSVFYNLVSNAVKYSDPHKENSKIEIEALQEHEHIVIIFKDNGIGFDAEGQREKLFKPFSRLNSYGEGKGLGLYLVKIELEAMNGTIDIQSQVDAGTTVTLTFTSPGVVNSIPPDSMSRDSSD